MNIHNYDKHENTIRMRNYENAVDFHDLVKTLLYRMIKRDSAHLRARLYTEYSEEKTNIHYPDIQMVWLEKGKKKICSWEIQEEVSESWIMRMNDKYNDEGAWKLVPLQEVKKKWESKLKTSSSNPHDKLKEVLKDYL